jgi:predicted NBD/HSP70 family sugar kinase
MREKTTVLCVDIGGTSTKAGLLNSAGRISSVDSIPTGPDWDQFAPALCGLIERTADKAVSDAKPRRIGVAVAGFLDDDRTHLVYNPNLPWLQDVPLKSYLAERFDIPIELEIDSNAACMAEYRFGFNEEPARFLCVTAGTGLGVGMTIDGQPLRFAYGCMGDVGHLIVDRYGPKCSCQGRGCAEAFVSAPTLAQRYRIATRDNGCGSLRDVIAAAERDDSTAVEILRDAGTALGVAIASMANIFFPDHIAIAGGLSAAGDFVMEPMRQTFLEVASKLARSRTKVSRASLGSNATLIGAAWPFWKETCHGESKS